MWLCEIRYRYDHCAYIFEIMSHDSNPPHSNCFQLMDVLLMYLYKFLVMFLYNQGSSTEITWNLCVLMT